MEMVNLSGIAEGILYSWLPQNLDAEKVVFFPDACPGKSPLPTGTVVMLKRQDWRRFAVSDVGCGMRLLKSEISRDQFTKEKWNKVADLLKENKGRLGDLGGGNHFLDALEPYLDKTLYFLIHTGSRNESGLVDDLIEYPDKFDQEYIRITQWAHDNRCNVQEALEKVFGPLELILDLPHNSYEILTEGNVIIRKGAVRMVPGGLSILPSHMSGDVALIKACESIGAAMFSMSHGTGRKMSRSEAKIFGDQFDFQSLRSRILMPEEIDDSSMRTEGPFAYRDLDECLMLLDGYVETIERFSVVAYLGHL